MSAIKPLNPRHALFVDELFKDPQRIASYAYAKVYGDKKASQLHTLSSLLMQRDDIKAEIERRNTKLREDAGLQASDVLRELYRVATADPRHLMEYHRGACRYCHGLNFQYQRTPSEYEADFADYLILRERMAKPDPMGINFPMKGGIGYTPKRPPHPDCPECFGDGVGYELIRDTRTLTPDAARLFAGVQRTKDGLKILTRSQDKAIELAGKTIGLWNDRPDASTTVKVHGGLPLAKKPQNESD